jgi:UDP-N-acetylglucosamine 2-epimerase
MADVALAFGEISERRSDALERLGLESGTYLLTTAHRAENVDDPARLERLVELLSRVAGEAAVVFPVHPRTSARLSATGLQSRLEDAEVVTLPPVGYLDMTRLLRGARALITDSGGLQKEAYLAGVPCVTLRDVTEWTETVEAGWNRLVGLDAEAAVAAVRDLAPLRDAPPPDPSVYGGGDAGQNVADSLSAWLES